MTNMKPALAHDAYVLIWNMIKRGTVNSPDQAATEISERLWPRYHSFFTEGEMAAIIGGAAEIVAIEVDLAEQRRQV